MKKFLFFFLLFICNILISKAEKIRVLQYNLTQYATHYSGCSFDLSQKDSCLRIIFSHAQPDIITVNEIGANVMYAQRILDSCLNINGEKKWAKGKLTANSGEKSAGLANMIFYNQEKLQMYSSSHVSNAVRDFNIYKLYFKTPQLLFGDTTFLVVIIAHLKAGFSEENATLRASQIKDLMTYLNKNNILGNVILCGDLNLYSSSEQAYQFLTNPEKSNIRFYDPVSISGDWHGNARYAFLHTQSTHKVQGNCFAVGGLDDRFDFILVTNDILKGKNNIKALPNTYQALGQDGNHFGQDILSGKNHLVSKNLLKALYDMSDHLPLMMDFDVKFNTEQSSLVYLKDIDLKINNPFDNQINFSIEDQQRHVYTIEILSIFGQVVYKKDIQTEIGDNEFSIDIHQLNSGIYCLKLSCNGVYTTRKIVKK